MSLQAEYDRRRLVRLIWIYFVLLLVEGALRKWILPSLSHPLLLVRDPVAVMIVVLGFRARYLVFGVHLRALVMLFGGFVALGALQLINGISSPLIVGYGLRSYFLHLPVAFVMARVLNASDLRRILTTFMIVAIPMAILMALQFESSRDAWINAGVAGHAGQIFADRNHIRPAGTFSYIEGPIGFFAIVTAALLASHIDVIDVPVALRVATWIAVPLATAVSGSRSLLATLAGVLLAGLAGWARSAAVRRGLMSAAVAAAIGVNLVGSFDTVQEGLSVIQLRLNMLRNGGLLHRMAYNAYTVEWALLDAPPLGVGLGAGTNVAAAYEGARGFRWGEGEWPRVIFEAGPLFGALYLLWRMWLTVAVARAGLRAASRGAVLPLLLLGACGMSVIAGQWGQATIQGFGVFTLGLSLAAGRCAVRRLSDATERSISPWVAQRAAAVALRT